MSLIRRILSTETKNRLRLLGNQALPMSAISDSAAVYSPWPGRAEGPLYHLDDASRKSPTGPDGLPVPPPELRMGYYPNSDDLYVESGKITFDGLMSTFQEIAGDLDPQAPILEYGCATGRVLRHFKDQAQHREIWGVDQHETSILWAKGNLSPPFNFAATMRLPHLPFEDGYFGMLYGISVFTHTEFLVDAWLLELRRILAPGGCAMLTIHDETTVAALQKQQRPDWIGDDIPLAQLSTHEQTVAPWGVPNTPPRNDAALPFYQSDYIRRHWGRYFARCEIHPNVFGSIQTLVTLQKATR